MIRSKTLIGLKRLEGLESLLYAVIGASGTPEPRLSGTSVSAGWLVRVRISRLANRIAPEQAEYPL
jgi:hypothetical protein